MGWKFTPGFKLGPSGVDTWEYRDDHGASGWARKRSGARAGNRHSFEWRVYVGPCVTPHFKASGTTVSIESARLRLALALAEYRRDLSNATDIDLVRLATEVGATDADSDVERAVLARCKEAVTR